MREDNEEYKMNSGEYELGGGKFLEEGEGEGGGKDGKGESEDKD